MDATPGAFPTVWYRGKNQAQGREGRNGDGNKDGGEDGNEDGNGHEERGAGSGAGANGEEGGAGRKPGNVRSDSRDGTEGA